MWASKGFKIGKVVQNSFWLVAMPVAYSTQTTEVQNIGYHNNSTTLLWSRILSSQNDFGTLCGAKKTQLKAFTASGTSV